MRIITVDENGELPFGTVVQQVLGAIDVPGPEPGTYRTAYLCAVTELADEVRRTPCEHTVLGRDVVSKGDRVIVRGHGLPAGEYEVEELFFDGTLTLMPAGPKPAHAHEPAKRTPGETFGLLAAVTALQHGGDLDYVTYHGLTHREVLLQELAPGGRR